MKNNRDTLSQSPQELLHELQSLVTEAEQMIQDSPDGHTDDALAALRERFQGAQDRLAALYSGVKQKCIAGAKSADEAIRANPYQAVAIAAGVGVLLGVLLGRRSR